LRSIDIFASARVSPLSVASRPSPLLAAATLSLLHHRAACAALTRRRARASHLGRDGRDMGNILVSFGSSSTANVVVINQHE
jgi:hypothetical protein